MSDFKNFCTRNSLGNWNCRTIVCVSQKHYFLKQSSWAPLPWFSWLESWMISNQSKVKQPQFILDNTASIIICFVKNSSPRKLANSFTSNHRLPWAFPIVYRWKFFVKAIRFVSQTCFLAIYDYLPCRGSLLLLIWKGKTSILLCFI